MRNLSYIDAYERLKVFCANLGWQNLALNRSPMANEESKLARLEDFFFTVGEMDSSLYVQINPQPKQHARLFAISVYAMRYRLCTGWHGFMLDRNWRAESESVGKWVSATHFCSPQNRKLFRVAHPECAGYSWSRIRDDGPPYEQSSTYERWLER